MNANLENSMSRIADKARGRYAKLVSKARQRTESAANRVVQGKKPVKTMTGLGLKLTAISHKTADQVLRQQTKLVEHQIDAVAGRLKAAADAKNVAELVGTQIVLIRQNVSRFAGDARDTLSIVAGAGFELRDAVKGTIAELRNKPSATRKTGSKKASAKKTTRKTAKKTARKTTRKTARTTARKATKPRGNSAAAMKTSTAASDTQAAA